MSNEGILSILIPNIKNDGATRGASACAARATTNNSHYSIVNIQSYRFTSPFCTA
jgi:hypothetical protein